MSLHSFTQYSRIVLVTPRNDCYKFFSGESEPVKNLLKIFDDKEQEWQLTVPSYRSPLPSRFRWCNWAKNPEGETGEDLIDFIKSDRRLLAYVADVSGHGLAAGQLMGMLKTAIRVSLQFRADPIALLQSADRVLPTVKEPDMYATLALLYFDGSTEVEYALAGHLPILHYRDQSRDVVRLSMEQFPVSLIPGGSYTSRRVTFSPHDLFLMLTDGISEVPNEHGEEFGLNRLEQLLVQHAAHPLPRIWEVMMREVSQYGPQQDDQTLLLLRVCR